MNVAGAYWRGDEKSKQLTRVYAITFPKQKELTEYLERLEEAKKRDHRKLGKELELFAFSEKVGMGLPLWLPKGTMLRERLEKFMRKAQVKAGYQPVVTPHIGSQRIIRYFRPLRKIRRRFFPAHPDAKRRRRVLLKAHELPASLRDL